MSELDVYLFNQLKQNCNQFESDLIENIIKQNYCYVLNNHLIKDLLNSINLGVNETNLSLIESQLNLKRDQILRIVFYCGISCLQLYVFNNFLAFVTNDTHFDNCFEFINQLITKNDYNLCSDGEECYSMARSVSFLKFSRFLFTQTESYLPNDEMTYVLWTMRSAIIHQMLITVPSNTLFTQILFYAKTIEEFIKSDEKIDNNLKIQLLNEMINTFLWFGDIERVRTYLESAQQLSGFTIGLSGALGVRTHFQQKPVSQLMVKINRNTNHRNLSSDSLELIRNRNEVTIDLPKNVVLSDDTLLQSVKFVSEEDEENTVNLNLTEVEQTLMLSFIKTVRRIGSTSDELLGEELESYLEFLIGKTRIWTVLSHCLLMRSLLQKEKRRRVERSMTQINELVDSVRESQLNSCQTAQRSQYFYSVLPNPFWVTEKYLANILVSLGVTKSALDIYLRLNLWDDIIACYQRLGRRDKAEDIIRNQLKAKETPYLYCLLGDTTDDIEYYEKSWQLSEHKYPRAQKSLGNYYFKQKQYSESIEFYKRSVELNSMQTEVWFHLGFAAMIIEDYDLAASAYRRVVQFESNSFEAWNNLSKAYIKLGQKSRSWKTLQEAIKCNYDEWKIWDNYIAVCVDIGAFAEAIHAWHRLIDIKGQYIDDQIAQILIDAICDQILDRNHESAAKLATKAQELFGRIAATSSGTTKMWRLYAKLLINNGVNDIEKVIQCLQKCHRNAVQSNQWERNPQSICEVLNHCSLLANEFNECALLDPTQSLRVLSSSKLALNSVMVLVHKNHMYWSQSDRKEEIESLLKDCEKKFEVILNKIKEFN